MWPQSIAYCAQTRKIAALWHDSLQSVAVQRMLCSL